MTTDTLDSLEETDVSDDDDVDWEINLEDDVDSSASDDENNTVPKNVVNTQLYLMAGLSIIKDKVKSVLRMFYCVGPHM